MQLSRMFAGRSCASLLPCLGLSLWIGVTGAAEGQVPQNSPEPSSEPIEQIEITGRATRLQLQADIERTETQMFGLFNDLNDAREFDVRCGAVMVTGSRIAERECVPIYMKRVRMNAAQKFLFTDLTPPPVEGSRGFILPGSGVSIDRRGVPEDAAQLWFQNNPKHKAFNQKFRELAAEHPELLSKALDLQTKRQQLEELEKRARE